MCGRYTLNLSRLELEEFLGAPYEDSDFLPRFNIAPSQRLPILPSSEKSIKSISWGLRPRWLKDEKAKGWINARSETAAQKPAFRSAFQKGRCLVPATSFFEWVAINNKKHPVMISVSAQNGFAMAGIYENDSFAILTCEANEVLKSVHDRMPVILDPQDWQTWLSGPLDAASALMKPFPQTKITYQEVSTLVNAPKIDRLEILNPVPGGLHWPH